MLITTQVRAEGGSAWRRLGKIKLGIKVKNAQGVEYPKDLDYFVVPDKYKEKLGEAPKELSIVLANPDLIQNFDTKAAYYLGNNSRACWTTDDQVAHRYLKPDGQEKHQWVEMACPNVECQFRKEKKCQERGYFQFMIPASEEIGVFSMIFSTKVGITQIYTALKTLEGLCQKRPQGMQGIRLKLRREARDFFQDLKGTGQQAKITKYIPMVEIDYAQLLREDQALIGPMLGQRTLSLPSPALTLDAGADGHADGMDGEEAEEVST